MTNMFQQAKSRLANQEINQAFFTSLDHVFKGLCFTGIGIWIASLLQIMFVSPWLSIPIPIILMLTIMKFASNNQDTKAALTFYLFSFMMGIFLYSTLYMFSIILTPQVVVATIAMSLLWSAALITLSLIVFAYRSNAEVAKGYMPMIYQYGFCLLFGLIIFGLFMNPANMGAFMLVDGLISSLLFSVFLVLDVFKAAYMTDVPLHPVMMATTLYLDILNIIIGVLEMKAGKELYSDGQSSTLGNFFMSLFGFLLPILFGVYLVYDAFWGSNDNHSSANNNIYPGASSTYRKNIPVAQAVVVDDFDNNERFNSNQGLNLRRS